MKNIKRIFCLSLVMAMIFTLPGMTHIVSAATRKSSETDNTVTMTRENQISGQPLEAVSANRDLTAEYESGIWKQSALANVAAEQGVTLASETTEQTPPDMMYALRKVNPVFSVKNNNNETIDLNTGSLNLSYPLASMAGVNGMDLSLSLNYSSSSANTLDKGYSDPSWEIIGDAIEYSKYSSDTQETEYFSILVSTEESDEFLDYLSNGPYTETNAEGQTVTIEYRILGVNPHYEYVYEYYTAEVSHSVAENGLGYGWHFNIPYIKKLAYFDEGELTDYYRTIVLDNGKGLILEGDILCDFIITEENASNMPSPTVGYTDYQYTDSTETVGNQSAAKVLSYKDGTKYYFDENDLCIGKEDRFGNQIVYNYANGKLSSITDGYHRQITLTWETNAVEVTASNGSSVRIVVGENAVSSICYNNNETSSFTYVTQNISFGDQAIQIPHILLTEITHPNQCTSIYEYQIRSYTRPNSSIEDSFQIKKRYDMVNSIQKNIINYSYGGNYMTDYSSSNQDLIQNQTSNNIWTQNGIDYDDYAIISNYSTTVTDGISTTIYSFNPNGYCNSIEVKQNGITVSVTENLYDCDKLIATRETLSDTSGDTMSYFTVYTYDTLKNVVSVKKFQNGESVYYEETATYNNPYSLITSSSVNGVVTNYTYSSDSKILSSVEIREDEILREKAEYTYLSNGNIKTEKVYILPGSTTVTTTYHYG
ncbi:MAG: hypothetical protein IJ489_04665, partial [Clostridia bacterium]|nr:hypothetical protein [Clostridia bacterium]